MMRFLFWMLMLFMGCGAAYAQQYDRVKIHVPTAEEWRALRQLPVAADHGMRKGNHFTTELRLDEVEMVREAGLDVEVLIQDVSEYYRKRSASGSSTPKSMASGCEGAAIEVPTGFELGSMGGFFTYEEYVAHLDNMAALYPNLITVKQAIGGFQSHEGRPIYWVRISDNPNVDENEPEVLYTAIHHAREAGTLSQLVFYMYHVLEQYALNAEVADLVNNTEMYFIPLINPDGYVYNQTIAPQGGGMWRKNRRNNNNGTYGVDLNRNYSYQWGGAGTSSDTDSDVYKGPSPMSEPELQAIEWFAAQHEFITALNYHSYADQLLFPWGYTDAFECSDHDAFTAITDEMVAHNGYLNQQSALLYPAAGDSDDWGYAVTNDRPAIYSMTAEIGGDNDGFWPAQQDIIPLSIENVHQNLTLARSAANYARAKDRSPLVLQGSAHLAYSLKRIGWQGGDFTVSVEPVAGIASVGNANEHSGLAIGQTVVDSIPCTLAANLQPGDAIVYVLAVDNGLYTVRDTVTKVFGSTVSLFANSGQPSQDWTGNATWDLTSSTYVTAPYSLTDSPSGNYPNSSSRVVETAQPIDLSDYEAAFLRFSVKWAIEQGWDYAQVSASANGNNWVPLCGNYTVRGNEYQDDGQPVLDGFQETWVREEMDLSAFVGGSVYIQFRLESDQSVREDGIYIDDVEVLGISSVTGVDDAQHASTLMAWPNPNDGVLNLMLDTSAQVRVYNGAGQCVYTKALNSGQHAWQFPTSCADGVYWVQALSEEGTQQVSKVVLAR